MLNLHSQFQSIANLNTINSSMGIFIMVFFES